MDVLVTSLILTNAKTVEKISFDNLGFLIYPKEEAKNIPMEFFYTYIDHDVHDGRIFASFTLCFGTPSNPDESWSASLKIWGQNYSCLS